MAPGHAAIRVARKCTLKNCCCKPSPYPVTCRRSSPTTPYGVTATPRTIPRYHEKGRPLPPRMGTVSFSPWKGQSFALLCGDRPFSPRAARDSLFPSHRVERVGDGSPQRARRELAAPSFGGTDQSRSPGGTVGLCRSERHRGPRWKLCQYAGGTFRLVSSRDAAL
jgi:hypothetical protein